MDLFCWAVNVPAIRHPCPSAWYREEHTSVTWRLIHRHAWRQRWSQIGVACIINLHNGSIGTNVIPPPKKNNLEASSTWTDGEFWQTSWAYFRLCSASVNWTRQLDQSAMGGWPWQHSVNNTGCCYRKPPSVKIWLRGGKFYSLSLVIKQYMLLNYPDSRVTDSWLILCSSSSAILSPIMTVSVLLFHACHCFDWTWFSVTHPIPQSWQQISFVASKYLFLHHELKIHVKWNKQPRWQHIYFYYIYFLWTIRNFGHVTVPGPCHATVPGCISRDGIFYCWFLLTRDAWAIIVIWDAIALIMTSLLWGSWYYFHFVSPVLPYFTLQVNFIW